MRGYVFAWGRCWHQAWNHVVEEIVDELNRFPWLEFFYEDNGVGTAPQDYFAVHGVDAIPRTTLGDKHDRIFRVGAYLNLMRLRFVSTWCCQTWLSHTLKFNKDAEYDDAPDSLTNAAIRAGIVSDKMKIRGRR